MFYVLSLVWKQIFTSIFVFVWKLWRFKESEFIRAFTVKSVVWKNFCLKTLTSQSKPLRVKIIHVAVISEETQIQNLMVEVYKSMNHLNPEYIWDFFAKKNVPYNLRTKELCKLPSVSSQHYGTNSLSFRGSLLCIALSDDLKLSTSLVKFKK